MASLGQEKTPGSDSALLYVGTYTEGERTDGIYLLRMDTRTGELRRLGAVNAGANPSFLAIHPNGRVLYAVNEVEKRNGKATGAVNATQRAAIGGRCALLRERGPPRTCRARGELGRWERRAPPDSESWWPRVGDDRRAAPGQRA